MSRLKGQPPKKGPGAARRPARRAPPGPLGEIGADAPFGIVVADDALRCTSANAAFASLVGADLATTAGRALADLLPGGLSGAARGGARGTGRRKTPVPHPGGAGGVRRRPAAPTSRSTGPTRRPTDPAWSGWPATSAPLPEAGQAERSARLRPEAVAERLAKLQEVTAALSAAVTEEEVAPAVLGTGLHVARRQRREPLLPGGVASSR